MMARLIDAEKLNAVLQNQAEHLTENGDAVLAACLIVCQETVERQPTIEAAPVVHGRWDDFCNGKMCCCSVCKAEFDNTCNDIHGEWKFCPNCSAKMDGGVSDG